MNFKRVSKAPADGRWVYQWDMLFILLKASHGASGTAAAEINRKKPWCTSLLLIPAWLIWLIFESECVCVWHNVVKHFSCH